MGNPNAVPSDQTPINHFSHPHPLQLLDSQTLGQILQCSACKLDASGPVYTCKSCNFILHPKCYRLPQQLQHPFHQNHALILQPKPVYSEGLFCCDACGNEGGGFSYHCSPCGIDLHTTCAFLNMEFTHQCHNHKLNLTFSAPYPGNTFSCDVCKRVGSKTWIYRCNGCQFDVHVNCVAKVIPAPQIITTERSILPPNYVMNPPNVGGYGAPMPPQHVVAGQPHNQFVANRK